MLCTTLESISSSVRTSICLSEEEKKAETNDRNLLLEAGSGGRIGHVLMTEMQIIDFSHLCKESISIEMALGEKQRKRRWRRRKGAA